MSGGRFQYQQHNIWQIAEEIQNVIDNNSDESLNEWGDRRGRGYSPEVIAKLHEAVQALKVAYVYAQRADWLLSDDDGEESFLERLEEELSGMNKHRCAKCGWKWTGIPEMTGLSEKELDEMVGNRARELVRLAFERSMEGTR